MAASGAAPELCIQVAGVLDAEEAALLVSCGVRWIGFPLRLPVHREDTSEEEAAAIASGLPAGVRAVLITYLAEADAIRDFCVCMGMGAVQLHGDPAVAEVARLRRLAPELFVIKSLVVRSGNEAELAEQARAFSPHVDAFITDTFDPDTGACGATGRVHDWDVSRRLVQACSRPVILAGGLTPDNVADAVRRVRPWGVDAHTGLEDASGRKDRARVRRFVLEAQQAWGELDGSVRARPVGSGTRGGGGIGGG